MIFGPGAPDRGPAPRTGRRALGECVTEDRGSRAARSRGPMKSQDFMGWDGVPGRQGVVVDRWIRVKANTVYLTRIGHIATPSCGNPPMVRIPASLESQPRAP